MQSLLYSSVTKSISITVIVQIFVPVFPNGSCVKVVVQNGCFCMRVKTWPSYDIKEACLLETFRSVGGCPWMRIPGLGLGIDTKLGVRCRCFLSASTHPMIHPLCAFYHLLPSSDPRPMRMLNLGLWVSKTTSHSNLSHCVRSSSQVFFKVTKQANYYKKFKTLRKHLRI